MRDSLLGRGRDKYATPLCRQRPTATPFVSANLNIVPSKKFVLSSAPYWRLLKQNLLIQISNGKDF